jgi:hypothetical protein
VRFVAAASVIALVVGFHLYPGNVLRASAGIYYHHDHDHNFNNFPFFPFGFNNFNNFGTCGFSYYSCLGPGTYPLSYAPTYIAPTYPAPYTAPMTQVVGATTTVVTQAPAIQIVGGPSSATATPGNPVVTLSAGSAPQPLAPGCTEVHLDGGTGLTVDKLLAKISPASNVQNISKVDSTSGVSTFVYVNSGSSTAPTTLIGSGQLVLVVCIVGFNTTIAPPSATATP